MDRFLNSPTQVSSEGGDHGNSDSDSSYFTLAGSFSFVALQPWLGILAERRSGADRCDSFDFVIARKDLGNQDVKNRS